SNIGVNATYDFLNTSEPERTVMPLVTEGPKKNTVPDPIINTNATMWEGTWSGKRITARVSTQEDGSLVLSTEERRGERVIASEPQTVALRRVVASYALQPLTHAVSERPNPLSMPTISVQKILGTGRSEFEMLRPERTARVASVRRHMDLIAGIGNN